MSSVNPIHLARQQSLYRASTQHATNLLRTDQARLQEQMATGLRINRASDDPSGYTQARSLDTLGRRYEQYLSSIDTARLWSQRSQDELNNMADLLSTIYEAGVEGNSATRSQADRDDLANQIESLFASVVGSLNAQSGDEYLFAGNRTDTAPFDDAGLPTGTGFDGERTRTIGPNISLAINITADEVQNVSGGFTVTDAVQGLITALRNGDPLDTAMQQVEDARDHVLAVGARAGTIGQRLTSAEEQIRATALTTDQRRSQIEEVDYLEAITQMKQKEVSLQAALQTTATISEQTLLNYLR